MAVDVTQLAQALRLTDGTAAPTEPVRSILARLLDVATDRVEAVAPNAPETTKDEAIIRYACYLYDMPPAARGDRYADAFGNSGAGAILTLWVERRAAGATEAAG